jgi:hypothetical protein
MGPVMNKTVNPPTLTSPESGQSFSLQKDSEDDTLVTFKWSKPDYGFTSAPDFKIEMDVSGNNFTNAITLATVNKTSHAVTVGDINGTLISNGFPADLKNTFDFRVVSTVGNMEEELLTETVTLSLTPYPPFPSIYASGDFQSASGYDVAPALVSPNDDNIYEGYVYFENDNSEFTFTSLRGSGTSWGDDGNDKTLEEGGANIQISSSGYYRFIVNMNDMTYSVTRTEWGLIGSATADGWNADQDMTYDPEEKVWTITTDLTAGEMKFRANDAWGLNYGDDEGDGFLETGGGNISLDQAGNYTITLDLGGYYRTYNLSQN